MADGFKKYFNGTTVSGRANVAKATYATLAVFYLLYRVRRTKADPKDVQVAEVKDQCNCDTEKHDQPTGYCDPHRSEVEPPEKNCAVCREKSERRAREEGCNHDPPPPPPPPPPSNGGGSTRRRCPCEDQHRHIETPKQTTHLRQSSQEAPQVDQVHPAREIIGHMHEAASRILRNVIDAVLGDPQPSSTCSGPGSGSGSGSPSGRTAPPSSMYESEETCNSHAAAATAGAAAVAAADSFDPNDNMEDDGSDYVAEKHLLNRRSPRNSLRSCVPTNTSGDTELLPSFEQPRPFHQAQSQAHSQSQSQFQQPDSQSPSQPESQAHSQSQYQSQSRYHGFNDDFASEMLFEEFDE